METFISFALFFPSTVTLIALTTSPLCAPACYAQELLLGNPVCPVYGALFPPTIVVRLSIRSPPLSRLLLSSNPIPVISNYIWRHCLLHVLVLTSQHQWQRNSVPCRPRLLLSSNPIPVISNYIWCHCLLHVLVLTS